MADTDEYGPDTDQYGPDSAPKEPLFRFGTNPDAKGFTPSGPFTGEFWDHAYSSGALGTVMKNLGQGIGNLWGGETNWSKNIKDGLTKAGVFNDYKDTHLSVAKSINEAWMRPAIGAVDVAMRTPGAFLMAGYTGLDTIAGALQSIGQGIEDSPNQDIGKYDKYLPDLRPVTAYPFKLAAEGVGYLASGGGGEFGVGSAEHFPGQGPQEIPHARPDPVATSTARAAGVVGEGERGYYDAAPVPENDLEARASAAQEAGIQPLPPARQKTLDEIAPMVAPETFNEYHYLQEKRADLEDLFNEYKGENDPRVPELYQDYITYGQRMSELQPEIDAAYRHADSLIPEDVKEQQVLDQMKPSETQQEVKEEAEQESEETPKTYIPGKQAVSPEGVTTSQMVRRGDNLHDILDHIAQNHSDSDTRELASTLRDTIPAETTHIKGGDIPWYNLTTVGRASYTGEFRGRGDTIQVSFRNHLLNGQTNLEPTFLHEAVHAATARAIDYKTPAGLEIQDLYDAYKQLHDGGFDVSPYGFKNPHEFIAEALTNPKFRKILDNIKAGKESLWTRLIKSIKSALGVKAGSRSEAALQHILDNDEKILSPKFIKEAGERDDLSLPQKIEDQKGTPDSRLSPEGQGSLYTAIHEPPGTPLPGEKEGIPGAPQVLEEGRMPAAQRLPEPNPFDAASEHLIDNGPNKLKSEDRDTVKTPLVVARKFPDGTIEIGGKQDIHSDLLSESERNRTIRPSEVGFADDKGKFYTREETNTLKKTEDSGTTRPTGLSANLAKKVKEDLGEVIEGLPEHQGMNISEQVDRANELISNDPETAEAVAMGDVAAPEGVRSFAVYKAVEEKATAEGDIPLLIRLARSKIADAATEFGKQLRLLRDRVSTDPVELIKSVMKAREAQIAKRGEKDVLKGRAVLAKESSTVDQIEHWIRSIECEE